MILCATADGRRASSYESLAGLVEAGSLTSAPETMWIDIVSPTEDEVIALGEVFEIHSLTLEDILAEDAREKLEVYDRYLVMSMKPFTEYEEEADRVEMDSASDAAAYHELIWVVVFKVGHYATLTGTVDLMESSAGRGAVAASANAEHISSRPLRAASSAKATQGGGLGALLDHGGMS
jgi:hypothetical protein